MNSVTAGQWRWNYFFTWGSGKYAAAIVIINYINFVVVFLNVMYFL